MDLSLFDFELPDDRIAQRPLAERDASRLLVLPRESGPVQHRTFRELPSLLRAGDLLVLNDTAVFPARLVGRRPKTGAKVEVLLLADLGEQRWEALVRTKSQPARGEAIELVGASESFTIHFDEALGEGRARVLFPEGVSGFDVARRIGQVPLPPYVGRPGDSSEDRERYQTVYAGKPGAVAAPTAGLHFTPGLLDAVRAAGVRIAHVTLHVGLGTFLPVRVTNLDEHRMHEERYDVPDATRAELEAARCEGRRIVSCGTTAVRALESYAATGRASGTTSIFLRPGHRFQLLDGLITNFHLPKSTLIVLVSAFAGRERVLEAYREAIVRGYRFYSYGDAMLIA